MKLIKKVEQGYRQIRSYLQPSHRRSAIRARAGASAPPEEQPICLFDFHSIKIDSDMGRYLHHLVTEFESCGYYIAFTDNYRFLATVDAKAFKRLVFERSFSLISLQDVPVNCRVLVTDDPQNQQKEFEKIVTIDYRRMRSLEGEEDALDLPYFVHPEVHDSRQVAKFHQLVGSNQSRVMRILFAGSAAAPKYNSAVLEDEYRVMSRVKVLEVLKESLPKKQLRMPQSFADLLPKDYSQALTIATSQDCSIPSLDWIQTLGRSDFYLACPGVGMPLCHNLIEALAAGAIPILQYPQYLGPALEDGVNCLTFNDEEELCSVINRALNMGEEELAVLRTNAVNYYSRYLQPGFLAQKLTKANIKNTQLYMNACEVPRFSDWNCEGSKS